MTRIYFLRHGVTDWNEAGRWQGQTDIPLSAAGVAQAEAVAERLASFKFSAIYSSDLSRALDTAKAVAKRHNDQSIITTEGWRERNAGVFEGMTSSEIKKDHPDAYDQMMAGFLEPPEGESFPEYTKRVEIELNKLIETHSSETILVASHGGTIRAVASVLLEVPQTKTWACQVGNTSLSLFEYTDRGWQMEFWNDTQHLQYVSNPTGPVL